jgi:hypothetical protein
MKRLLPALVLFAAFVPLAACNQNANKAPAAHGNTPGMAEHGMRGLHLGRGGHGGRGGGGHGGHGLRRACATELQQYCATQERGRERRDCLQSHMDQLSADCKAAVEARGRGRRQRDFQ